MDVQVETVTSISKSLDIGSVSGKSRNVFPVLALIPYDSAKEGSLTDSFVC